MSDEPYSMNDFVVVYPKLAAEITALRAQLAERDDEIQRRDDALAESADRNLRLIKLVAAEGVKVAERDEAIAEARVALEPLAADAVLGMHRRRMPDSHTVLVEIGDLRLARATLARLNALGTPPQESNDG